MDERFWQFHGLAAPKDFGDRSVVVGAPLAAQLGVEPGDTLLLRIETGHEVPGESLYGRRESAGRTIRLTCSGVASSERLGEFALRPGQGTVFSVFVPLKRLQRDLAQPSRVNAILVAARIAGRRRRSFGRRSASGLPCRTSASDFVTRAGAGLAVESARILLDDSIATAAFAAAAEAARRHPACSPISPTSSAPAGARFPTASSPRPTSAGAR